MVYTFYKQAVQFVLSNGILFILPTY